VWCAKTDEPLKMPLVAPTGEGPMKSVMDAGAHHMAASVTRKCAIAKMTARCADKSTETATPPLTIT